MASFESTSLPLTLQHELNEIADAIQGLLFLSEGDCNQAGLDELSEQLTHLLRYARALGFHAAFIWSDGEIAVEWQPLARTV
jgi:hypothetical protein